MEVGLSGVSKIVRCLNNRWGPASLVAGDSGEHDERGWRSAGMVEGGGMVSREVLKAV